MGQKFDIHSAVFFVWTIKLIFEPLKHYPFMTICSWWSLNIYLALQMRIWSECEIKFSTYIPKYRGMANFYANKFQRTFGV